MSKPQSRSIARALSIVELVGLRGAGQEGIGRALFGVLRNGYRQEYAKIWG